MRLKVIACKTLTREIGFLSASCPNTLDIVWLGNSGRADTYGSLLQDCIDKTDSEGPGAYDAIVLALGADAACGVSSQWFPILVPRVHDCTSLLLGSAQRMRDIMEAASSELYWYTPGILERHMPDGVFSEELTRYSIPVGAENARCLLGMERDWEKYRGSAAYVQLPGVAYPNFSKRCAACAEYLGWPLVQHEGDASMLRALLDGEWDITRFLTVPPTQTLIPSYHEDIACLFQSE